MNQNSTYPNKQMINYLDFKIKEIVELFDNDKNIFFEEIENINNALEIQLGLITLNGQAIDCELSDTISVDFIKIAKKITELIKLEIVDLFSKNKAELAKEISRIKIFLDLIKTIRKIEKNKTISSPFYKLQTEFEFEIKRYYRFYDFIENENYLFKIEKPISISEQLFNLGYFILNSHILNEIPKTPFKIYNNRISEHFFISFDIIKYSDLFFAKDVFELSLEYDKNNLLAELYINVVMLFDAYHNEDSSYDRYELTKKIENLNQRFPKIDIVELELAHAYLISGQHIKSLEIVKKINLKKLTSNYICYKIFDTIFNIFSLDSNLKNEYLKKQIISFSEIKSNKNSTTENAWYNYARFKFYYYIDYYNENDKINAFEFLLKAIKSVSCTKFIDEFIYSELSTKTSLESQNLVKEIHQKIKLKNQNFSPFMSGQTHTFLRRIINTKTLITI
jgi:hypothetical protein